MAKYQTSDIFWRYFSLALAQRIGMLDILQIYSNMDYYKENARAFVESTLQVDMRPLYQRFLPLLPERALILDAGCGSGRDAKSFIELGHQVTAFDSSVEIAALAEKEIGQPVHVQRVQDIRYEKEFDGIWACASLLHVPAGELPDVFRQLARALKSNGVIYCSFKYGQDEYEKQGRRFTDLDEAGLSALMNEISVLTIKDMWVTSDRRPARQDERWLNAILTSHSTVAESGE
jgi:SAM-dependent methyltransferase